MTRSTSPLTQTKATSAHTRPLRHFEVAHFSSQLCVILYTLLSTLMRHFRHTFAQQPRLVRVLQWLCSLIEQRTLATSSQVCRTRSCLVLYVALRPMPQEAVAANSLFMRNPALKALPRVIRFALARGNEKKARVCARARARSCKCANLRERERASSFCARGRFVASCFAYVCVCSSVRGVLLQGVIEV